MRMCAASCLVVLAILAVRADAGIAANVEVSVVRLPGDRYTEASVESTMTFRATGGESNSVSTRETAEGLEVHDVGADLGAGEAAVRSTRREPSASTRRT